MLLSVIAFTALAQRSEPQVRDHILFDDGWKFALGNASDPDRDFGYGRYESFAKAGGGTGPLQSGFDDSDWRTVDLPHDWAVELPFVKEGADPHVTHGFKPVGRAYPETSVGWYRKTFNVDKSDLGRRITVQFDGAFRDSQVWLNGHFIGRHLSGYTGFNFDLSDVLEYGAQNTLVVRVDASQYEGWFYEGAGIYRHVWLNKTGQRHFQQDGVVVVPTLERGQGRVLVRAGIEAKTGATEHCRVHFEVRDDRGSVVSRSVSEDSQIGSYAEIGMTLPVQSPRLWSPQHPALYQAKVQLETSGKVIDEETFTFGFRTIEFDKDRGILVNGVPTKIRGACCHQDHAGVGAAVPDRLNEWRLEQLKAWGFNALRTSHNPPTPELMDACDRLGILVFDETRMFGSSQEALDQLSFLVKRDRNHPSVICWSIGNEEWTAVSDAGGRMGQTMMDLVKNLDPTRPVSYASNSGNNAGGVNSLVDWRGFNYKNISDIDKYHKEHPDQLLWGSEEASALSTRGEYVNDREKGYMSSYDLNQPGWGATAEDWWSYFNARPWLAGAFVWTGFDYRGEPTPYKWPCISSHFGVLDTCGFPKDTAYYYKAWWTDEPVVHILPHWTWPGREGKPVEVWVYSNEEEVELLVNGESQGRKRVPKDGHLAWTVTYEPGALLARGFRNGKVHKVSGVATTTETAILELEPDRSQIVGDGRDVAIVTVRGKDTGGRLDPLANSMVTFDVTGGHIIGVGNGDPSCHEPDKFVSQPGVTRLENWRWTQVQSADKATWHNPDFDDSSWSKTGVGGDGDQMKPNTTAVFRTTFESTDADTLTIGQMDDEGWVYLNGEQVMHGTEWDKSYSASIKGKLKAGMNVLVVVVKNNANVGGLGRGVRLSAPAPAAQWSRSLFHGLAQVIVQSDRSGSDIVLTAKSPGLKQAQTRIKVQK